MLGEYDAAGKPIQETVYLGDMPVAVLKPGPQGTVVYYVYADHLNTPRAITDTHNNLVWRWDNGDPFGVAAPDQNPSGLRIFEYNLRFPGQLADRETYLVHNGARYYDGMGARYAQSDPIGLFGGINTYAYVEGNPISFVDPEGLLIMSTIGGLQRGVTGDQAATYGAPGNAAATAGAATAGVGAAGIGAGVGVAAGVEAISAIPGRDLGLGTIALINALSKAPGMQGPKMPSLPTQSPTSIMRTIKDIRRQSQVPAPKAGDPPFCQ